MGAEMRARAWTKYQRHPLLNEKHIFRDKRATYGVFPQELIPTFGSSKVLSNDADIVESHVPWSSISNAYLRGEACVFGSRLDPESEYFHDDLIFRKLLSVCGKMKWSYECWLFTDEEENCATYWGYSKQKVADEEYVMVRWTRKTYPHFAYTCND